MFKYLKDKATTIDYILIITSYFACILSFFYLLYSIACSINI